MKRRRFIWAIMLPGWSVIMLLHTFLLSAQRVSYCEPASDRSVQRMELVGKAGPYYWIQTIRSKRAMRHGGYRQVTEEESFDIYDARMSLLNEIPSAPASDKTLKEYFVAGDDHFDELTLLQGDHSTILFLHRYEPDGEPMDAGRTIGELPFVGAGNDLLMIRSQDRGRILVLGFETVPSSAPKVHALLFDQDWRPLSYRVYRNPSLSQPLIQDDFAGYPLEDFDKGAIKLANNGQWLMAIPSRANSNYLLFHFNDADTALRYKELVVPPTSYMEDVGVAIDNEKGTVAAGVLSDFHNSVVKTVRVIHYSMAGRTVDFDSSYRFNTLVSGRLKDDNLVKENFIPVPGKGFLLLKEYGRSFLDLYGNEYTGGYDWYDDHWDPSLYFAGEAPDKGVKSPVLRDGYARYNSLGALGKDHQRGDLNFFYFPDGRGDSCWSGMISQEQITEMNTPNLSYFVLPVKDKLYFLYNILLRNQSSYASTTVIDPRGNLYTDQGILFWGFKNILRFQQSRQLSESEVVIPYGNYGRYGFAIIQF